MPCDAQTLENLGAALGDPKLSEYDLMVVLAYIHGNSAGYANSQAAVNKAASNGYGALSDDDLDTSYLAVTCTTCEASAALAQAISRGYLKLADGDVADTVATKSSGVQAQTLLNSAYAGGYGKLSERSLKEVAVAGACGSNCTAKQVIASVASNGYFKLSEKGVADCALSAACGP